MFSRRCPDEAELEPRAARGVFYCSDCLGQQKVRWSRPHHLVELDSQCGAVHGAEVVVRIEGEVFRSEPGVRINAPDLRAQANLRTPTGRIGHGIATRLEVDRMTGVRRVEQVPEAIVLEDARGFDLVA